MRSALVVHGPSVWVGLQGDIISEDEQFAVVRLDCRDAAGGGGIYDVRMPWSCLLLVEEVLEA
jgi:hypothetical protein